MRVFIAANYLTQNGQSSSPTAITYKRDKCAEQRQITCRATGRAQESKQTSTTLRGPLLAYLAFHHGRQERQRCMSALQCLVGVSEVAYSQPYRRHSTLQTGKKAHYLTPPNDEIWKYKTEKNARTSGILCSRTTGVSSCSTRKRVSSATLERKACL